MSCKSTKELRGDSPLDFDLRAQMLSVTLLQIFHYLSLTWEPSPPASKEAQLFQQESCGGWGGRLPTLHVSTFQGQVQPV